MSYLLLIEYSITALISPCLLQWKNGLIRGVASHEDGNLVEFVDHSASKIWPDERGDIWWEWPYKRGTTVAIYNNYLMSWQRLNSMLFFLIIL